jgi:protein SCO1
MARAVLFLILVAVLVVPGCGKSPEPGKPAPAASGTNHQMFQVKGVVLEVKPADKSVKIKHEEVPGYMPAMTMPFDVRDTNVLAGIEPGDPVSFRLIVTDTEGWIDQIKKIGPKTNLLPMTGQFRFVREVEPLKPGDPLPDYRFTNQLGRMFSTGQFKGQALALEFLFTRCPYPTFCPLMANHFEQTQKKLLALTNGPANWQLLTITFDPEFDTPPVLKAYAESHHYDPAHWTFATAPLIDITAIGEQFDLVFWRDETGGVSHNLRAAVIDASGRVRKIFVGNEWTPDELAAELVKAAATR